MTSTVDIDNAQKLFALPAKFIMAAAAPAQCPPTSLPEIAFAGRSNVGKSSLINAVLGRKALARASNTPGRTQQIIFFDVGNKFLLADLPGYGFADAPLSEKAKWNELIHHYLRARASLRVVCLLIDGRHGTLAHDLEMMSALDRAAVSYRIVLTKADKVHATEIERRKQQIQESLKTHAAAHPHVLITSSDKASGIQELRTALAAYAT